MSTAAVMGLGAVVPSSAKDCFECAFLEYVGLCSNPLSFSIRTRRITREDRILSNIEILVVVALIVWFALTKTMHHSPARSCTAWGAAAPIHIKALARAPIGMCVVAVATALASDPEAQRRSRGVDAHTVGIETATDS